MEARHHWSRRQVVRLALMGAAGALVGCVPEEDPPQGEDTGTRDSGETGACTLTNADIEGPFYVAGVPIRSQLDTWGDAGLKITLSGIVTGQDCAPRENAVIEIWHADDDGAYDNDSADLRYRGQQATDAEGRYSFTTILPGRYLNGQQYRPAHIHVKVWVDGVERLTTQLYFDDDPFNEEDAWFEPERSMAVDDQGDGTANCTYDFSV